MTTYCAWCKKCMSGPDCGYHHENATHGICHECLKEVIKEPIS